MFTVTSEITLPEAVTHVVCAWLNYYHTRGQDSGEVAQQSAKHHAKGHVIQNNVFFSDCTKDRPEADNAHTKKSTKVYIITFGRGKKQKPY